MAASWLELFQLDRRIRCPPPTTKVLLHQWPCGNSLFSLPLAAPHETAHNLENRFGSGISLAINVEGTGGVEREGTFRVILHPHIQALRLQSVKKTVPV